MKYKLICFDLDGTLVDETKSVWESIRNAIEIDWKRSREGAKRYHSKEINYKEWAEIEMGLWKESSIGKGHFLKGIGHFKLMPGAKEALLHLKDKGYKLMILSGSISLVLDIVLPGWNELFDHVFINRIYFNEKGQIIGADWLPRERDNEGKAEEIKEFCLKEGIDLKEVVFVGDSDNDVSAMRLSGLGIAFNSQSEKLNQAADVIIGKKDVREILRYL